LNAPLFFLSEFCRSFPTSFDYFSIKILHTKTPLVAVFIWIVADFDFAECWFGIVFESDWVARIRQTRCSKAFS
jgi:hypothetical protein